MSKTAVFVIGTMEPQAVKRGEAMTDATIHMLDTIAQNADLEADIVFVMQDSLTAGKGKVKIPMKDIRAERPRVLDEIDAAKPDFVMCLGPVATACVFDHGSLVEGELLRQAHYPLGEDRPPVHVTFGLENIRRKDGLRKWLCLDIDAAVHGHTETQWGDYTVLLPDNPDWHVPPAEIWDMVPYGCVPSVIGYDLETWRGLDPWESDSRIRMAVISDQVGRAWVVQATPDSRLPQWVYDLIEDPSIVKSGSNIKFDYKWHARFGHRIVNMYDTSTHEHIIDESNPKKDLKSLTFRYVEKLGDYSKGHRDEVRKRGGPKEGWQHIEDHEMYQYAGGDGEASIGAFYGQAPLLKGLERPAKLFYDLYAVLAEMEHNGACISIDTNRYLDRIYIEKLEVLRDEIVQVFGPINPNSPAQLAKALKAKVPSINLRLKDLTRAVSDDESEDTSTKRTILEREAHKHPVIPKILEFRSYGVRHRTFIKKVYENHAVQHGATGPYFIHPSFRTDVVDTYRLSSRGPNGQNIPRKDNDDAELTIKKQFVSRFEGGEIMEADQSQVEIRFAAWISGDPKMISAIESGEDIHTAMAAIMLDKPVQDVTPEERQECKARTFLILYGGGAKKLAQDLQIGKRKAQKMINEYFEVFSGLKKFIEKTHEEVKWNLNIETVFGFKRHFVKPEQWNSSDGYRIQRQAFNTLVQNGAACITYCSMIWLHNAFKEDNLKSKIVLQVHDSIVVDVAPGERDVVHALMRYAMEVAAHEIMLNEYGIDFNIPLVCDIEVGPNWGNMNEISQCAA